MNLIAHSAVADFYAYCTSFIYPKPLYIQGIYLALLLSISHLNFLNKPSKHQIGLTLSCLITVFIRILSKTGFRIFFRLKTGWNFSEGASTLEQTAAHAYTLHFSEILIISWERAWKIMDLGPEEKFLKSWEVSRNRALKRFAQFFVQPAADGLN